MNESTEMSTMSDMWPVCTVVLRFVLLFIVTTTKTYFRVDAGEAERPTGMGGEGMASGVGTPTGRERGDVAMAVTGALAGRVALTGCWGLLAAVSLATVSW